MPQTIYYADDEKNIRSLIFTFLTQEGFTVRTFENGDALAAACEEAMPDLVILDIMMPGMDGIEVLCRARESGISVPILMLTAKSDVRDKVNGLDSGANDYMTKPFSAQELLARIRAMTRVSRGMDTNRLTMGNVMLDLTTYELSTPTGSFRLTGKEFQMMEMLLSNQRRLIPTERFLEKIWGYDTEAEVHVVWVYISYLRKKLSSLGANVQIRVARNAGYSLEEIP